MRRRPTRAFALSLLGALALVAAGCGGSSKPTTTTTTTAAAAATTTSAAATTTAAASPTTTAAAATTTTSAAPSGLGALASTANCASLANLGTAFGQAIAGSGGDIQKSAAILQQFAAQTPSDIRSSFEVVAAAFAKIASTLKGYSLGSHGVPNAATIAKLEQLSSQVNTPALAAAEKAISAWSAKNCHG